MTLAHPDTPHEATCYPIDNDRYVIAAKLHPDDAWIEADAVIDLDDVR